MDMSSGNYSTRKHTAETVYISHPNASYGIFCYNSVGDLFLNSDYGMYGYAWRSFGDDFKSFLAQINSDYLMGKLEMNYRSTTSKKIPKYSYDKVKILCEAFIEHMNIKIDS